MQCQDPLVLWVLSSVLMLWAPTHPLSVSSQGTSQAQMHLQNVDQALPISSMMRQIGNAALQGGMVAPQDLLAMAALPACAVQSNHWYVLLRRASQ